MLFIRSLQSAIGWARISIWTERRPRQEAEVPRRQEAGRSSRGQPGRLSILRRARFTSERDPTVECAPAAADMQSGLFNPQSAVYNPPSDGPVAQFGQSAGFLNRRLAVRTCPGLPEFRGMSGIGKLPDLQAPAAGPFPRRFMPSSRTLPDPRRGTRAGSAPAESARRHPPVPRPAISEDARPASPSVRPGAGRG